MVLVAIDVEAWRENRLLAAEMVDTAARVDKNCLGLLLAGWVEFGCEPLCLLWRVVSVEYNRGWSR
jgi:hypothetical protein